MKLSSLNEVKIYRARQGDEQHRRDQQLLHVQLLEQNRDLREAHEKSLNEMEELKRFRGSTFNTISSRKLIEDRDTILELTGKIQELQNEIHCMNDSRDCKDVESVRSGQSQFDAKRPNHSQNAHVDGIILKSGDRRFAQVSQCVGGHAVVSSDCGDCCGPRQ